MKTFFPQQKPYFNNERLISHLSDIGAIVVIVGWIYVCMKQQKWLSEHVFVETTRRWSSFPEQTLPATCESKAPWETRVQDKENKPQVRNTSSQVHALLIFFLAPVYTPDRTRSTAGHKDMPHNILPL